MNEITLSNNLAQIGLTESENEIFQYCMLLNDTGLHERTKPRLGNCEMNLEMVCYTICTVSKLLDIRMKKSRICSKKNKEIRS